MYTESLKRTLKITGVYTDNLWIFFKGRENRECVGSV